MTFNAECCKPGSRGMAHYSIAILSTEFSVKAVIFYFIQYSEFQNTRLVRSKVYIFSNSSAIHTVKIF